MKHLSVWIAICLSLAAVVLSVLALHPTAPASPAPVPVDLAPVVKRVGALEDDIARVRELVDARHLEASPSSTREARASSTDPRVEQLAARIDRLEKSVEETRAATSARSRPGEVVDLRANATPRSIEDLTRQARDLSATEAERLAALRELRMRGNPGGADARMPVLADMIRLAQTSTQAETRADVWRQLNHIHDPSLERALLDALASDPDPMAREKAADTLADYWADPVAQSALHAAMQNDADAKVRAQAAQSLTGGK